MAGSRGNKQMQLRENVRKGDETGALYGDEFIKITRNPLEYFIFRGKLIATGCLR
jgi:hypothetical protein